MAELLGGFYRLVRAILREGIILESIAFLLTSLKQESKDISIRYSRRIFLRKKSTLCPPFFKTLFKTSDCNKLNIAFDTIETKRSFLKKKKKNNPQASQLLSPTRWDNVIGASSRIFLFPGALSIFVIYSSAGEGGCLVGDVTGSYINSLSASHPSFFKGRPGTRDGERKRERESGRVENGERVDRPIPPPLLHLSCKYTIRPVVQFAKTKQVLDPFLFFFSRSIRA